MLSFVLDGYDPNSTTLGVDFRITTIKSAGKAVKLQIWDTAGMDRMREIAVSYIRPAMGIILVYDVSDLTSFTNITKSWLPDIKLRASPEIQIVLVGAKSDVADDLRKVSRQEGMDLAKEHGWPFFEVSAKEKSCVALPFMSLMLTIQTRLEAQLEAALDEEYDVVDWNASDDVHVHKEGTLN